MYDQFMKGVNDDVMGMGIARAKSVVDASAPKIGWEHKLWSERNRKWKQSDPEYIETKGWEIQWSQQEAAVARRYLDMMERAKHTKGYLKSHGFIDEGDKTIHFREWRDNNRAIKQSNPLETETPFENKDGMPPLAPTAAFPGVREQTADLTFQHANEAHSAAKEFNVANHPKKELQLRVAVPGKVAKGHKQRFEDAEEEAHLQKMGFAPGTLHPHFSKYHDDNAATLFDDRPVAAPNVADESDTGEAAFARERLIEQLTKRAQGIAMESASNQRVRALLVKNQKVREQTLGNKLRNKRRAAARTTSRSNSRATSKAPSPAGSSYAPSAASSSRPASREAGRPATAPLIAPPPPAASQGLRTQGKKDAKKRASQASSYLSGQKERIAEAQNQLQHHVNTAVQEGLAVATHTVRASGQIVSDAPPPEQQASDLMYKAHVIMEWPSTDPTELHLYRGDIIYVFEDDENGYFRAMDSSGLVGRIPSNIVQFDEPVPKERPMQPGGLTDPLDETRPKKVYIDELSFADTSTAVDLVNRPEGYAMR